MAFWDLRTEAHNTDSQPGRIPWSSVMLYARAALGVEPDMLLMFWKIVCELDAGYIDWVNSERTRHARNNKPAKATAGTNR